MTHRLVSLSKFFIAQSTILLAELITTFLYLATKPSLSVNDSDVQTMKECFVLKLKSEMND